MKKKIIVVMLGMTMFLVGCGNKTPIDGGITQRDGTVISTEGPTEKKLPDGALTPPEPNTTEAPLSQDDESRRQRAEDVNTASTIATAVKMAMADEKIFADIQKLETRFFDIEEPLATNGDDSQSIAFSFADKELGDGLNALTKEVGTNLGNKTPEIMYRDANWNPTVWRVWILTDNSVEVILIDKSKEDAGGIRKLYPEVDESYQ